MGFFEVVEDLLDRALPKVAATRETETSYDSEQYRALMQDLAALGGHRLRSASERSTVVQVDGDTVLATKDAVALLKGAEASPAMYQESKFRYRCDHLEDGRIRITAFEHLLGMSTEQQAFRELLEGYAELLLRWIAAR